MTARLAIAIFFCLLANTAVLGLSCEECLNIEKESQTITSELDQLSKELRSALESKEYKKAKELDKKIFDLKKKQIELRKHDTECEKACTPEALKRSECKKQKLRIKELESKADQSEEDRKIIDQVYQDLLRCNKELQRLKPGLSGD
ncbi:MAG: hypothetical protein AB1473_09350 [Thermodesulfobacteriota bacterium]